jgi:hypothetical protein
MVLVLNSDYSPIIVMNTRRAFNLIYKNRAEIVIADSEPINAGDNKFTRPSVIRLFRYITLPYKKATLSRYNIYRRDNFKCLYCGSKENLTLDHVVPRSKGGTNNWNNLATCCNKCNVLKGDKSLEETNMKLSHKPFTPNYLFFIKKMNNINDEWRPFLIDK